MAQSSKGVLAVGALPGDPTDPGVAGTRSTRSGNALLAALGAWLTGSPAAIAAVTPAMPAELMRDLIRAGIDVSRVRAASAGEVERGDLQPTADQLASVGPAWAVHVCSMSPGRQRDLVRPVWQRVPLVTIDSSHAPGDPAPTADEIIALARTCDAILLGRREIVERWPRRPPRDVLHLLRDAGSRTSVIMFGGGGAVGLRDDSLAWIPADVQESETRSPTSDAFAGAFAAVFMAERDLLRAMAWAAAAASAVGETATPLERLDEDARRTVALRAAMLQTEALQG